MARAHGRPSIAIIGSGLAGGLLALRLSAWAQVTIFERGGNGFVQPEPLRLTGRPLGLDTTFAYGLGGTTNLWRGCMLAMMREEFGDSWPQDLRDGVIPYFGQVIELLYGAGAAREWRSRDRAELSADMAFDTTFSPTRPARIAGFRMNPAMMRLGACVETLAETASGITIHFAGQTMPRSETFDLAVVACGAINSPLLLKRSGLGGSQVGLNLTDHPMGVVGTLTRGASSELFDRMKQSGRWKRIVKYRDPETGLWTSFQLCPTHDPSFDESPYLLDARDADRGRLSPGRLRRKLSDPAARSRIARRLTGRLPKGRHAHVLAMCEQEPYGRGRVTAGHVGAIEMDWEVSDRMTGAVNRSLLRFARLLEADLTMAPGDLADHLWSGAHHAGTCRAASAPDQGVVDADLRVRGTSRVYICDASVLPSTGASNPGLTIGALALRLADRLKADAGLSRGAAHDRANVAAEPA